MPTAGTSPTTPLLRITVPRRIEASPEEVFDAWADPDLFRRWFQPHRAVLRKAAVDELWYWEADHAGRLWAHYCRYLRVERPRLLEFAWMSEATRGLESRVTIELTPSRGATDLVDAQRAPRRRDGPRPRGGLEALHRHPGREDQRAGKERRAMTKHMTGTRKEWLAARLELLEAEKELTRRSDELARRRQELVLVAPAANTTPLQLVVELPGKDLVLVAVGDEAAVEFE